MSCDREYEELRGERDGYVGRARAAASLTVPYLIPLTDGGDQTDQHPLPWTGIGQSGVHNLASRLSLALLPPTETFFRFTLDEIELLKAENEEIAAAGGDPDAEAEARARLGKRRSEWDMALARIERAVLRSIETSNDRVAVHEMIMHLVVAGNALMHVGEKGLRCYHLNRYVLRRDPIGNPMKAITCEEIAYDRLPKNVKELLRNKDGERMGITSDGAEENGDRGKPDDARHGKTVKIYTEIEWKDGKASWYQEVEGMEIPRSRHSRPIAESPWLPVRMYKIDGANYSPGYIEAACLADLRTANQLDQAITEGALVSAQVKHLVRPNATTSARDLAKAANGAYLVGNPEDVTTIQVNKAADLGVALQKSATIEARLSQAFMLVDVRDSERTTREEVRLTAQQVEMALGAVYAILTVEFQSPYISRKLALLLSAGKLPELPEMVKPVVSVGLAALGRGNDLDKTARFMAILQQTLGPEGVATYVQASELIRRLAASMGMDTLGLVKTEEQLAREAAARQEAELRKQVMATGMTDPQKLANAAATVQQMGSPPPSEGEASP